MPLDQLADIAAVPDLVLGLLSLPITMLAPMTPDAILGAFRYPIVFHTN